MTLDEILLIGVPHTGNHFLITLLPGAKHRHPGEPTKANIDWPELLDAALVVICPMRHPLLVARSWRKRGKQLPDLNNFWQRQVNIVDRKDPFYICLDRPDLRDAQVQRIADETGLDLNPGDWPVLRDRVIHNAYDLTAEERSYVANQHWAPHEAFFDRWYHVSQHHQHVA